MYILLTCFEILLVFLLSRKITQAIYVLIYTLLGSERVATVGLSFIFIPGTIIHELAHFLMAKILFVRTGKIELRPERHEDGVKLGSVQVAKTDMLRRFWIGVAPLLIGSGIISLVSYYMIPYLINFHFSTFYLLLAICYLYAIFVITNTMFSSKKDMEGVLGLLIFVVFLLIVILVAGKGNWLLTAGEYVLNNPRVEQYGNKIALLLLVPLGINVILVGLFQLRRK